MWAFWWENEAGAADQLVKWAASSPTWTRWSGS